MKKSLTVTVVFLILAINPHAILAQDDPVRFVPSCGGPFGKCGFVRMEGFERKEEVLPQKYEAALEFSEGLAGVRINGRWGFIDMKGEIIIDPQFDLVGSFMYDLAEVLVDGKVGVINRKGDLVIKPQFARAMPFTKNVVLVKPGEWRSGYFRGREKLTKVTESLTSCHAGSCGLYSVKSGWITKPEWDFHPFDNTGTINLIWAKHKDRDSLYGLMRPDGTWHVEPRYDHVQWLCEDRAIVAQKDLWGAVDPEGKLVVPLRFGWLGYWSHGFALTRDSATKKEGLVDKDGNLVGGRFFDKAERGSNGIGRVMIDDLWHGIDGQGNIVANPSDNRVYKECPSGLQWVEFSGKMQLRDKTGKPTMPYLQEWTTLHGFDCDGINSVKHNGKWGYVDRKGHLLFDPPEFDTQFGFNDGYAAVKKDAKWGIINEQGKFTVEPAYDELRPARDGLFTAKLGAKEIWINAEGLERSKPEPKSIDRDSYLACSGGLKIIPNNAKGDLWGMADENNNIIVKPVYRAIHCFQQGVAWVPNEDKSQWCPVDSDGNLQDYPKCVTTRYPYIQTHHYPEQLADDTYENSVLWSRAFLEFGAGLRKEPPRMIGDGIMSGASSSIIW